MIKFRGVSKSVGELVYGLLSVSNHYGELVYAITTSIEHFNDTYGENYSDEVRENVHTDTVAQFTGLQDSTTWEQLTDSERVEWESNGGTMETWKGKDIYGSVEIDDKMTKGGDVIGSPYPHKHAIEYNNDEAAFVAVKRKPIEDNFDYCPVPQHWVNTCEKVILGIASQNPKLFMGD